MQLQPGHISFPPAQGLGGISSLDFPYCVSVVIALAETVLDIA